MKRTSRVNLLEHLRPLHLVTSLAVYLLGLGLARYLGEGLDPAGLLLGLAWLVLIQLGFFTLGDHFGSPFERGFSIPQPDDQPAPEPDPFSPLLLTSVSLLAGAGVLTLILGLRGSLHAASALVMGCYFLIASLLTVPGIHLDLSGIREILSSTILVVLPPALAFLLQVDTLHRLLPLSVFPLFSLHLALLLVIQLKRYPSDRVQGRNTLLVRLGWVQAVFLHNLLVLGGFLLGGFSLLFGMPFRIIGPVFLVIPGGIFLIWYLSSLKDGAPVRWPLISTLSLVVFFLPVYLLTFTVWVR